MNIPVAVWKHFILPIALAVFFMILDLYLLLSTEGAPSPIRPTAVLVPVIALSGAVITVVRYQGSQISQLEKEIADLKQKQAN